MATTTCRLCLRAASSEICLSCAKKHRLTIKPCAECQQPFASSSSRTHCCSEGCRERRRSRNGRFDAWRDDYRDISDEEIERRFQEAKATIRARRRWENWSFDQQQQQRQSQQQRQ
jgi:hypothetical protein